MLIIMILGMVGIDKDRQKTFAKYTSPDFNIIDKEYSNSTDVLLTNFPNAKFEFITTKEALERQKLVFDDKQGHLHKLESNAHELKSNDDIDLVLRKVLEIIQTSKDSHQKILLDITHGMRHQPLMAAFGATLARVDMKADIQILYAKEIKPNKEYEYIFLDKYSDLGINAILLNGFISTLSMPKLPHSPAFIQDLQKFSNDLHTNAFSLLFQTSKKALESLQDFQKDYQALSSLTQEIAKILHRFDRIQDLPEYQQYYEISHIMFEKHYYLISVTYAFEALPKYIIDKFQQCGIMKDDESLSQYDKAQAINQFVLEKIANYKVFAYDKACFYYDKHKAEFENLREILSKLKDIRNNLVHINDKELSDKGLNIAKDLQENYARFYDLCIKQDSFTQIDIVVYDIDKLGSRIYDYFNSTFGIELSKNFFKQINFMAKHCESQNFTINQTNLSKLKNSKKAQALITLLASFQNTNYLSLEQGKAFDEILNKAPQKPTQTHSPKYSPTQKPIQQDSQTSAQKLNQHFKGTRIDK